MTDEIISHWRLIQSPAPLLLGEGQGATERSNPLIPCLASLTASPHLRCFQNSSHQHKPSCGGTGLVMSNKTLISPYDSEVISGTEDKRSNIVKKKRKDAPFALVAQEILRVLGAVNQEPKTTYIFFCHKS